MEQLYRQFSERIGGTPLVRLEKLERHYNAQGQIFAKIEALNPAGSVKDRIALAMVEDGEKRGALKPGATIIEPTSGNTGVGLAFVGAERGYRVVLTMPETMTPERRKLLAAYGAEIVLTEGARGMGGAIEKAAELCAATPGSFIPGQFDNPANPAVHQATTGPEIWRDMDGNVDVFVAGVGTGGTITGAGRFLRGKNPGIHICAVEPQDSAVLSGGKPGPHKIQGLGAGFIPKNLDTTIYDRVEGVSNEQAYAYTKALARVQGIFAGISSGAALCAAVKLAQLPEFAHKRIVVVLPDSGDRYLSTGVYED